MSGIKEKNNTVAWLGLILWVLTAVFFGLYENYKLRPPKNEKESRFNLDFPKPLAITKIMEVDLSKLNQND
ncbi:MAG: hypothetical protein KKC39_03175 [Candidatus Omnitrophica bacterium]|nr:hypothetical protein [Candidatus Omnitrophota bacterium]MBU4467733.1 hypothetical protein [Candidatus Omnitrophota bacterium]MCG2707043.1 hypothetical protein [Candidatus Omnitrophota bacterium]